MKSPIKWVGGKSKLLDRLFPLIPKHRCWVEVFGGAGWLTFAKDEHQSKVEILNDYDSGLMNFYSVVKNSPEQFIISFDYTLVSRELFDEYKRKWKTGNIEDAIEKAHIFYYLVNAGFGSDMKNPVFGTKKQDRNRLRLEQLDESIKESHRRLLKTTIENLDFGACLNKYDDEQTFFYLDPPYRKTKPYAIPFTDNDYLRLSAACKELKGKFLMTINNDEYIKELFKDFYIMDHDVYYSVCKTDNGRKEFKELIITNYSIEKLIK
jgi:DNA adenine methylase